jgi:hypothetical protein
MKNIFKKRTQNRIYFLKIKIKNGTIKPLWPWKAMEEVQHPWSNRGWTSMAVEVG